MEFRITKHAEDQMDRRDIPQSLVESVLQEPEQVVPDHGPRVVYQSRAEFGGRTFLVRAVVDEGTSPAAVVTVYRTTRLSKYWRGT